MPQQDITLGKACKRGVIGALVIFACGLLCVGGCGPAKTDNMTVAEHGQYIRTWIEAAKHTGAALTVTAHLSGVPNVYAKQEFGLDTGISATASFVVNPAAAPALGVEADPVDEPKLNDGLQAPENPS